LAFDREDTLKKAEKLLRQGRLDAAIAEYLRVVEDQPRDWNTANTLGDLYVRAGQTDKAAAQFSRIADHFMREGFYPKAGAIYKKLLKLTPDDEASQLQLAEVSVRQGLLADAKAHLNAVAARRRARGDRAGAAEVIVRLGSIDPADIEARLAAARTLAETGDTDGAAARFRGLHADLQERGRGAEARDALREAVRLNPSDNTGRAALAIDAVAAGDLETARAYLDREVAADDPALRAALIEIQLRDGDLDTARESVPELLAAHPDVAERILSLAWSLAPGEQEGAFICVDGVVDLALARSEFEDAAALLQEFVTRVPNHIPALLKLVEICVDGGLETRMFEAQTELAEAYLTAGQAAEARVIAEDLVAREPWEGAHIDRFRRALVMLKISDPDTYIAERLSGQSPFTATDPFAEEMIAAPAPPPPPQPESAPEAQAPDAQPSTPELPPAAPDAAGATVPAAEVLPGAQGESAGDREPDTTTLRVPGPAEIDLTSALKDLYGAKPELPAPAPPPRPQTLEDVFRDYRAEAKQNAASDQSAHHMTLGRTYFEMEMYDEAIAALTTAARSPRQRFEAGFLLGRLFRQRGDLAHAIEWFERAAEAPAADAEDGRALLYELGVTLQHSGESARALAVFLELQADAGAFRDIAVRIDHLSRVQAGG
jgi:tetratricopeptide (TPR) repeat protein